jgi:hypothetical protein
MFKTRHQRGCVNVARTGKRGAAVKRAPPRPTRNENTCLTAPKCPWRAISTVLRYQLRGAMVVRKYNSILREYLASFSLTALIALAVFLGGLRPVAAQSSPTDDGTGAIAAIAPADTGNVNLPAPSADYAIPADADASADSDAVVGTDSRVLEIPQTLNPKDYALAAAPADPDEVDANADPSEGFADPSQMTGPPDDITNPVTRAPDQMAQGATPDDVDDAQSYIDQADGVGGSVVVNAAPVFVPAPIFVPMFPAPVTAQANPPPQPSAPGSFNGRQLPMYSALNYRLLPMYSGLTTVVPGRYNSGSGTRLWNSRLGQGFGMSRGSMGGFSHAR